MILLIILLVCFVLCLIFKPDLDTYKDNKNEYHIILWYSALNGRRKYVRLTGGR